MSAKYKGTRRYALRQQTARRQENGIEAALGKLKEAHKAQDLSAIDAATAELNSVWQSASQDLYNAMNAQQGGTGNPFGDAGNPFGNAGNPFGGAASDAGNANGQSGKDKEVKDVDFEEVK
jgi:molecular chaperone DnaK